MRVAKSYSNYEYDETKAYEKGGKLYVHATCKCDRCTKGIFAVGVENGKIKPHPYAGGVCFKCGGSGIISKEVRLYTDKEFDQMERSAERAKEKKKAEQEKKMKEEFSHKKEIWLRTNGFNEDEETYIVAGDSYAIKDELKEAGFHWNNLLKRWMRGSAEGYEDKTVKVKAEDILEFSAWGEGHFFSNAKNYVDGLITANNSEPECTSEYVGNVGDRNTFHLTVAHIGGFQGRYGFSYVYSFKDEDGNLFTWFTAKNIEREVGDSVSLMGTIKSHQVYNEQKVTYITRCTIKD